MDFVQASDQLLERGVTLADIASELGLSYATVRAFRLPVESPSYRRPPVDWPAQLVRLARRRGLELSQVADELERSARSR